MLRRLGMRHRSWFLLDTSAARQRLFSLQPRLKAVHRPAIHPACRRHHRRRLPIPLQKASTIRFGRDFGTRTCGKLIDLLEWLAAPPLRRPLRTQGDSLLPQRHLLRSVTPARAAATCFWTGCWWGAGCPAFCNVKASGRARDRRALIRGAAVCCRV